MKDRYDYSRYDCFKAIDKYKVNSLLKEDIRMFLDRNNQYAAAADVENLMRRLDRNLNGRVTYTEFCDAMEAGEPSQDNNYGSQKQSKTPEKSKGGKLDQEENKYAQTGPSKINKESSSPLRQSASP